MTQVPLRRAVSAAALAAAGALCALPAVAQGKSPTLDAVRAKGELACGVIGSSFGFSLPDSKGVMQGIDADGCRAVAAATLGDASKVRYVPLQASQRLSALQSGEVDVLYAQLTWTLTRETDSGVQMAAVNYFDGTGFMVPKELGVESAADLDGASVCTLQGPGEVTMRDYFGFLGKDYTPVLFSEGAEARKAFLAGRCDAYMIDQSFLISFHNSLGADKDKFMVLPETISNEPLTGAVRKGDPAWFDIVRYAHIAMVNAEEHGITSANVDSFGAEASPAVKRILGLDGKLGESLGLEPDWAKRIIAQVGNYAEVWDRAFGATGADRSQNNLPKNGGLQVPYPMR